MSTSRQGIWLSRAFLSASDLAWFLLFLLLLILILLPSLGRARQQAKRAVCVSNLRGLGQGLHIYATDNREWFPHHYFEPTYDEQEPSQHGVRWVGTMGSNDFLSITEMTSPGTGPTRSHPSRSLFLLVVAEKSLTNLFERMGESPHAFVKGFGKAERKKLSGFKHRFTTGQDISDLLMLLHKILNQYGSIEKFFIQGYNPGDINIVPALSKFCDTLYTMYTRQPGGQVGRGLRYLLANPANGSACKRLNLFLRWMVRNDDVDTGLWKSIDKTRLVVPIDVHMGRLCKILGFYNQKAVSLKTAVQITQGFAEIEPTDPVKYDFSLSRIGIVENCNGQYHNDCEFCELFKFCRQR